MKKRNLSRTTIALFVAAALLAGTGALGTRAMINSFSSDYVAGFSTDNLNVTLMENGKDVAADQSGKLLAALDDQIIPGKIYDEKLQVRNTSNADQFVRVVVRKYWLKKDENGEYVKDLTKNPGLIMLTPATGDDWKANAAEQTVERSVYYYTKALSSDTANDANVTSPLVTNISINGSILDEYATDTQKVKGKDINGNDVTKTVTIYYYAYDGCVIGLEAEAQAVQTHSADEAINSVWGVKSLGISIDGDTLKVNDPQA